MATTDEETKSDDGPKSRYKLVGAKGQGEKVDRLVLEGTSSNPTRYIDVGGEGEMTEKEAEVARKEHGVVLRKVGDSEATDDSEGDAPAVTTRAQQQAAQAGPGSTAGKSSDKPGKS